VRRSDFADRRIIDRSETKTMKRQLARMTRDRGFTLIEMMIVVIIIGVISAIAYPAYKNYMKQSRRSDAQITLTQAAAAQEKFFSDCRTYTDKITDAYKPDCTGGLNMTQLSPEKHYLLSVSAETGTCKLASCFEMVADPNGAGTTGRQRNDGKFRITSTGVKQWDKANDGTYSGKWTDKK